MWQLDQVSKRHHWSCLKYLFTKNHACKIIYKNSLTLTLTLTLNHFSPPPLTISLTKIAFNSGDTSLNGIVMGFPPFPAWNSYFLSSCSLFWCLFCRVAWSSCLFGRLSSTHHGSCPFFLAAVASFWHLLFIGVWLYLQSSDIEKPQKLKGDRGGSTHYKNCQSETSRRKQCGCVSKKSGGLNLRLYHLERNVHPGTRLRLALGLVQVQFQAT